MTLGSVEMSGCRISTAKNEAFLEVVEAINFNILMQIFKVHVRPGSKVVSNLWSEYIIFQ